MADTWPFTSSSASIFLRTPKWQLHREASRNLHTHLLHSSCRKSPSHSWKNAPNRANQQQRTRVTKQILSLAIYHTSLTPTGLAQHITFHSKIQIQTGKVWSLWDDLSCVTVEFPQQFLSWEPRMSKRDADTHHTHFGLERAGAVCAPSVTSHKYQTVQRDNSQREVLW